MSNTGISTIRTVTAGAVLSLVMAACGGTTSTSTTTAASTTTYQVTTTTTGAVATTAGATTTTAVSTTAAGDSEAVRIAEGEDIFQRTAGGVGCAYCHKADATGDLDLAAPDIRGKSYDDIVNQLTSNPNMSFIVLDTSQIEAVVAYLATLAP